MPCFSYEAATKETPASIQYVIEKRQLTNFLTSTPVARGDDRRLLGHV